MNNLNDELMKIVGTKLANKLNYPNPPYTIEKSETHKENKDNLSYEGYKEVQQNISQLEKKCTEIGLKPIFTRTEGSSINTFSSRITVEQKNDSIRFYSTLEEYRSKKHRLIEHMDQLDDIDEIDIIIERYGQLQFVMDHIQILTNKKYGEKIIELLNLNNSNLHKELDTVIELEHELGEVNQNELNFEEKPIIEKAVNKVVKFFSGPQEITEKQDTEYDRQKLQLAKLREIYLN